MTWVRRFRGRRRRDDAGYSLVELLVTMGIASVLLTAIGVVFIAVTRGVRTLDSKSSSVYDGRTVMEAMTRTMRVAVVPSSFPAGSTAMVTAATDSVSFYALLNRTGADTTATPNPTLVTFGYDPASKCVTRTLTPQTGSGDSAAAWTQNGVTSCLGRTNVAPVFDYYTDGFTATPITLVGGAVPAAAFTTVRSIQMTVSIVDPQNPSTAPVPLIDRVTLTNIAAPAPTS